MEGRGAAAWLPEKVMSTLSGLFYDDAGKLVQYPQQL
jgi:hypothetical protein